jgi:hypothetical protein
MPSHREKKKPKSSTSTTTTQQLDSQPSHSELREVNRLLYLVYHRNKNQHRGQKWWKWVGMLRRSIRKLLVFEDKGWRRKEEEKEKRCVEEWMRESLLPGAWL